MGSTSRKRILILRHLLLMNAGVQSLLSGQEALDVIGTDIQDRYELFQYIEHIQPDIIIVDEGFLASNLAALLIFLQIYSTKRMIILSLEESQIQVYDTSQIHVQQLSDFLAVL